MNYNFISLNQYLMIIKYYFVIICTYYLAIKISNSKVTNTKHILFSFIMIPISLWVLQIKTLTDNFISYLCLIMAISFMYSKITKKNLINSILINTISISINNILFFFGINVTFVINSIKLIENDYLNLIIIMIIHVFCLFRINKIKRIKNGIQYLNEKSKNNELLEFIVLNISAIISFLFIILANIDVTKYTSMNILISFIIFSIIMFLTIQKSIELYYKQKLLIKDLNETKIELEDKKKEIALLEEENLSFSKKSHSLAHKQKALEHKINKLLLQMESAEELDLKDKAEAISKELYKDSNFGNIEKTGIINIDDMLDAMKEECIKNKIEFNVQIYGNIYKMINNYVDKKDLEILLADHIKDAIIAINHTENINRSILVKLGKIDDCYGIYFYDSGIEFDKNILENLGKKPVTTYSNEGGTGMGFMNTFDTLRKYNASLTINHIGKPSKENYTKIIIIKFDKNANFCLTN